MKKPFISIIIPVYNVPSEYLNEAVNSVLQQTYKNFEVLVIDDGSTTPASQVLSHFDDKRIRFLVNEHNSGLPYTLNKGLKEATGKYIFRMDGDDICLPNRIEKQVAYLENHSEVDLLGTYAITFGQCKSILKSSEFDSDIKAELLWKNPIIHPTVAFRASSVRTKNLYYYDDRVSEDYCMWARMAFCHNCRFAVLPEVLLKYRIHEKQVTILKKELLNNSVKQIVTEMFSNLNIVLKEEDIALYCQFRDEEKLSSKEFKILVSNLKRITEGVPDSISKTKLRKVYQKACVKYCLKNRMYFKLILFIFALKN